MIEWQNKRTYDSETMCFAFRATWGGAPISVRVSEEAMEDSNLGAIRAVAEQKIRAAVVDGVPPNQILVTTQDLQ